MTKGQFRELIMSVLSGDANVMEQTFRAEKVNFNSVQRMAQVVLAVDSAFEESVLYLEQGEDVFISALYDKIASNLANSNLKIESLSSELIMGILLALLAKAAAIVAVQQQAETG